MVRRLLFILLCLWATPAQAQDLVLRGGTVINADGSPPVADAIVVVRGGRIAEVGRRGRVRIPAGVQVIDAAGRWIVSGYIDSHVHFFQSGGLYTRPDGLDLRAVIPYETEVARVRADLDDVFARYLASGVTGVADVGGPMWNFDVRDRAVATQRAPRVAATGPLISTWRPPVLSDAADPPIIAAASAEEARALVRAQLPRRPDFIKIWYVVQPGQTAEQFLPIVRAAIEEAHGAGLRVAVHATELETARAALQAGADILVHGVEDRPVDAAFIALLRQRGAIYMTTLDVYGGYLRTFTRQPGFTEREFALADPHVMGSLMDLRHLPDAVLPASIRQLAGRPVPAEPLGTLLRNLRAVRDAGIPIALGTDAGNIGTLPGPSIYREAALMAQGGMTPLEVLRAATVTGARVMGRERDMGIVAPSRVADMVVLDADPRLDVANLSRIAWVVRQGRAYRQADLLPPMPADIVQRQLNAYNARDLDAFIATYRPDARLYVFPDRLEAEGHAAMRRIYGPMFANLPDLHAEVPRRIVAGNHVIDQEVVTGLPGGETVRATAIYEVQDGLIARVWFIEGGETPPAPPSPTP
jgi:imidazolonepropionase-like amidohydrolase